MRDKSTTTKAMDAALAELRSSDSPNISQTARVHNVDRSSLSRRFHLKTTSKAHGYHVQRLLNSHHGKELIKHIARLCDHCLPPKPCIVANIAHELCGRRPSKNWSSRFVARHSAELDSRYLNTLELAPVAEAVVNAPGVTCQARQHRSYAPFCQILPTPTELIESGVLAPSEPYS